MAIKPLNKIVDIKLNTIEDIADSAANSVINSIREGRANITINGRKKYSPAYAAKKKIEGRKSRETSYIDLTLSGNTLDSFQRKRGGSKTRQVVGFTTQEAENVARGWRNRRINIFNRNVIKEITKNLSETIDRELIQNMKLVSGRTTLEIG